jgi:threonine dehydrogenase-like Zn-dependent dehydrogenase
LCDRATKNALGIMQDGGVVEQFSVPVRHLTTVPDGLRLQDASLAEPAAVAWHGVRVGGGRADRSVAVVGGGSVGLLAAAAAQAQGAAGVVMLARYGHQHEVRERPGVAEPGAHERYDVVVEAAGTASGIQRAVDLVKPGGTVALLGVQAGGLDVPFTALLSK